MNEEMTAQEKNEAEIQMIEDPELDDRMNEMENDMELFWEKYSKMGCWWPDDSAGRKGDIIMEIYKNQPQEERL